MTLENAKKLAQREANEIKERVAVIYDKLNEDSDDLYTFCGENSMRWFYPSHHNNFFKVVEFVEPKDE